MKKGTIIFLILVIFSGCASFQLSTLNHDPVYSIEGSDTEVKVIKNEFELARLLRNDFNFRYDFAQYALSQPQSFDWRFNRMNRFMGFNRYGYNRSYYSNGWGYSSMWNRSQMWNDWVWGYPYSNGIGWSYSWNNNSWSSNSWNGWGNGYGYNAWHQLGGIYGRQQNVAYNSGRRMPSSDRRGIAAMGNSRIATTVKNNRVLNNNIRIIPKPVNTAIKNVVKIKRPIRNNIPVYNNPNRVIKNNNIPVIRNNNNNNTRTVTPRNTRTVVTRSTSNTRGGNSRRKN